MPKLCCIRICEDTVGNIGITHHSFPVEPVLREKWIEIVKKFMQDGWQPKKSNVICSRHFTESMFVHFKTRISLVKQAIPSVFNFKKVEKNNEEKLISEVVVDLTKDLATVEVVSYRKAEAIKNKAVNQDHNYFLPLNKIKSKIKFLAQRRIRNRNRFLERYFKRNVSYKMLNIKLKLQLKQLHSFIKNLECQLEKFSSFPVHLFSNDTNEYTEKQKKFAQNLHLCGPKAYDYLRSEGIILPHPRTLRRWLENPDVRTDFNGQVLNSLDSFTMHKPDQYC